MITTVTLPSDLGLFKRMPPPPVQRKMALIP
jgi:hypothetical protein